MHSSPGASCAHPAALFTVEESILREHLRRADLL